MIVGASTSNFYPMPVEDALDAILAAGFRNVEIFLNASSECKPSFVKELKKRCDAAGATVSAVHPYSSFMEPFFLYSPYRRRMYDALEMYKPMFEAAAILGAPYLVIHGDKPLGVLSLEQSLERFELLYHWGKAFGAVPAQENVVKFSSADPAYLCALRQHMGDRAKFVLDFKQSGRCGLSPEDVMDAMGDSIVHVHISDRDDCRDCLPPGQGTREFLPTLKALKARGYDGVLMLELYRKNFQSADDLIAAGRYLEEITCLL